MNTTPPLQFRWDGEAMVPLRGALADRYFVVGEVYSLEEHKDRSGVSHRHFFASVNKAWDTLPDALLDEYPTAEHLRKKALIRCGYAEHRDHVCGSKQEARKLRAFIKPLDEYAVIDCRENIVRVYSAKSQSVKAMGAKEFQQSKKAVLDWLDNLLGVESGATARSEAA